MTKSENKTSAAPDTLSVVKSVTFVLFVLECLKVLALCAVFDGPHCSSELLFSRSVSPLSFLPRERGSVRGGVFDVDYWLAALAH